MSQSVRGVPNFCRTSSLRPTKFPKPKYRQFKYMKYIYETRFCMQIVTSSELITSRTRMVQLPATAAIEYDIVAACWVSGAGGTRTKTKTKTKARTKTKTVRGYFVRGAYARSPQVQCVFAPSRLSMPSIVA